MKIPKEISVKLYLKAFILKINTAIRYPRMGYIMLQKRSPKRKTKVRSTFAFIKTTKTQTQYPFKRQYLEKEEFSCTCPGSHNERDDCNTHVQQSDGLWDL